MSPVELAIARLNAVGWIVSGIEYTPELKLWACSAYPGLFGKYVWGDCSPNGGYSPIMRVYHTAGNLVDAVLACLKEIETSPRSRIYSELLRAFQDNLDAREA